MWVGEFESVDVSAGVADEKIVHGRPKKKHNHHTPTEVEVWGRVV
jgi:hypothetical protein